LLLAPIGLSECSNMVLPDQTTPATGPEPTYGQMVSSRLKVAFKNLAPNDVVEISEPRWVHSMMGWNWLECVHFQDQGHRRTYVFFISGSQVADARYAVVSDACDAQTYSSLDLASGAIRPLAPSEQGPLY
jgi:hypothetical protein